MHLTTYISVYLLYLSRFWWGGSGGNENKFESKEICEEVCVDPVGKDACELPRVSGPCEGYYPRWGYDPKAKSCQQFIYGGCLGNNNKVVFLREIGFNLKYQIISCFIV